MEQTDHVLIAGITAEKLALESGLDKGNLRVLRRVQAWKEGQKQLKSEQMKRSSRIALEIFLGRQSDTVGAVALDAAGNLGAADSTRGVSVNLPGRVRDVPRRAGV